MKLLAVLVTGLAFLTTLEAQTPAPVLKEGPSGLDKAKLGAALDQVKKAYPKMEPLEKSLGAPVVKAQFIKRFVLPQMAVPGLEKRTDVELRFWKDKLWVIIVYFGENPETKVAEALHKQFGEPAAGGMHWPGKRSTVVMATKQKWYSINDAVLTQEASAAFMEDMKRSLGQHGHGAAAVAGTPGANPAPPAGSPPTQSAPATAAAK